LNASKGYGIASFPDVPVTPDTMFYGASTTKAFVAAALSLLVDDDENFPHVTWQTPITQIIPDDFILEDDYSTLHLTLEDAATHRTGLPRHDFACQGGDQTVRDVVRSMRYLPLTEPLRTTFQYCNLMYIMLGHVIETFTGHWLGAFLAERIWEPLNMISTYFSLSDALKSGKPFAQGYYWLTQSQTFTRVDYIDESSMEGCGAVISSVRDYSKWIRMMIDRTGPVSEVGHEALVTPRILEGESQIPDTYVFYGYGWEIKSYRGYEVITHNGVETGVSYAM
jgi:CubicO group peptidase (beta-lactamase class C family)